jgi:hypothetical protein
MDTDDVSYEESSSSESSSDSDSEDMDTEVCVEEGKKEPLAPVIQKELKTTFEIESVGDIDDIENDPAKKILIASRLISSKSYLYLFKDTSKTKFISAAAFNMLSGICEHQVQLNLQGEESLVQVVHEGMKVPISIVMKLTDQEEEREAINLKSKYQTVERECLVALKEGQTHHKELLGVLQVL